MNSKINLNSEHEDEEVSAQFNSNWNQNQRQELIKNVGERQNGYQLQNNMVQSSTGHFYKNSQANTQMNKTNNSIENNIQNNIAHNMNIESTKNIKHSPEQFSAQKMPSISVNDRSASPNRYYHQNNPSSTQTIITFGSLQNGIINRNNSLVFPVFHNQSSSRIIYEKEGQPLAHLPQYLRNRQLRQEVTVLPAHAIQGQQYMRNPSPQHTTRIVPKITFNHGSNSSIPTQRYPQNNRYIPPQQIHQLQTNYPQPQSQSQIVNIIRKQNTNEITFVYAQFHLITQQIQLLLIEQVDSNKKQKIRQLIQHQVQLQQKLKKLLNRLEISQKQNIQLKSHIKTIQNKLKEAQAHQTRPTSEITTQQDPRIYELTQKISQLQQINKNISTRNHELEEKVKILQSELAQINKQPIAPISINVSPIEVTQNNSVNNSQKLQNRQSNQQYANQLQQKYQQILQSRQDYIYELQSQNLKIKTQLSNLKKQANKQRNAVTINGDESSLVNSLEFYKNYQGSTQKLGNIIIKKQQEIMNLTKQQEQFQDILQEKDQKIKQLYGQITSMKENQLNQQKTQERATRLQEQMQQLKQELKIRKQQLSHNMQAQNKNTQQLHNKIQQLLKENEYLEQKISQLQEKAKSASSSPSLSAYQKINMELFQKEFKKKQDENKKLKDTIQSNFKSILGLENFILDFQNKFKDLEEQVHEERRLTNEKQIMIREFEAKQKEYQQRQELREEQVNTLKKQISELSKKLTAKKQEIKSQQIKEKQLNAVKQKQPMINQKLEEFRQNYSKSKAKIFELETELKTKQNKIMSLQNELKQNEENKITEELKKQIQLLKLKIKQNEQVTKNSMNTNNNAILKTNTSTLSNHLHHNHNHHHHHHNHHTTNNTNTNANTNTNTNTNKVDHVFQQKIIYQLQNQIQILKSKLSAQQAQQGMYQGYGRIHSKKVLKNEQKSLLGIQRRLIQFDNKLQQIIQLNQDLQLQGNNYCNNIKSTETNRQNLQIFSLFQRQKAALFKRHYEQIKYLQDTIQDLQAYCSSLQNYNAMMTMNTFTANQAKNEEKNIYSDQIEFFRQKNKELEGRVQFLMEVSKNLKQKLENASKTVHDNHAEYYKQQVKDLQIQISQSNKALKKLTQSKTVLTKELQKLQKDGSALQFINQLQKQIKELRNQNMRLQQNNKMLQTDIKKYLHQSMEVSKELLGYKTGLSQKQNLLVQVGYDFDRFTRKTKQYEQNIINLHNQNNLLKSQMNRLHEHYQSKKKQADIISQNIASRNYQLRQTISRFQLQLKLKNSLIEQYEQKLKAQNTNLATSYIKYQSPNSSPLNSRLRELEAKMGQFEHTTDNLSKQNYELKLILQEKDKIIYQLNMLTQHHPSENPDLDYYIQLIRSVLLNIQNLMSELNSQQNERSVTIIERIKQQIKMGLDSCSRIEVKK